MNKADEVPLLIEEESGSDQNKEAKEPENQHRYISLLHIIFRCAPLITYLFCGLFSDSFVVNFVWVILLLSLDFWVLKNISGRFMVGLRWWNYIDDNGDSHWVFESRSPEQRVKNDPGDVTLFWTALFAVPAVWSFFFFIALFSFSFKWLLLLCIALSLNFANLYGYLKCRFGRSSITSSVSSATKSFMKRKLIENMTTVLTHQDNAETSKQASTFSV